MNATDPSSSETHNRPVLLGRRKQVWGRLLVAVSPLGVVVFIALGALTINPCGAFGDACDSYGEATSTGTVMFLLGSACLLGFVSGVALLIADNRADSSADRALATGQPTSEASFRKGGSVGGSDVRAGQGRGRTNRGLELFSNLGMMIGFGLGVLASIGLLLLNALRSGWLMTVVAAFITALLLGTARAAWQTRDRHV